MNRPLFFYGVLLPGLVSGRMAELVGMLGAARRATVSGRLFAVADPRGHYPVMIAGDGGERVGGAVFAPGLDFGPVELAELDAFEDFDPCGRAQSDYVRESVIATLVDGATLVAEVYRWNRALPADAVPILHGDFARYLAESGARPLPG